jgi:hypothetical protein
MIIGQVLLLDKLYDQAELHVQVGLPYQVELHI